MTLSQLSFPGRAFCAFATLALLAACGFSESADWPAMTKAPAAIAAAKTLQGESLAPGERTSLSELLAGEAPAPLPGGGAALVGRVRPLVVIRFGAAPPDFEPTVYAAARGALERRPNSVFDLVALAPAIGAVDQAAVTRDSESVLRALVAMGLPAERLSLSATTTPGLSTHEVHIYVR